MCWINWLVGIVRSFSTYESATRLKSLCQETEVKYSKRSSAARVIMGFAGRTCKEKPNVTGTTLRYSTVRSKLEGNAWQMVLGCTGQVGPSWETHSPDSFSTVTALYHFQTSRSIYPQATRWRKSGKHVGPCESRSNLDSPNLMHSSWLYATCELMMR